MYFCYLDESGSPETTVQSSHFVLMGVVIPAAAWAEKDKRVAEIKASHELDSAEIHTHQLVRAYPEQEAIANFDTLDFKARRKAVQRERGNKTSLLKRQGNSEALKDFKKYCDKTEKYMHLSLQERRAVLTKLADEIASWRDVHLFADARDKTANSEGRDLYLAAFRNIVEKFHGFLDRLERDFRKTAGENSAHDERHMGLLIHDMTDKAKKFTDLFREARNESSFIWYINEMRRTPFNKIIETPLFVDSSLTSMVQMADLCAYAVRSFFENQETDLFDRIFPRFAKIEDRLFGIRHYTGSQPCSCKVCQAQSR